MKKIRIIIIFYLLLNICLIITGCAKDNKEELKQKAISELEYVNIKILNMLNKLNNLTFENYTIVSEQIELDNKNQKLQHEETNSSKANGQQGDNSQEQNNEQGKENQDILNVSKMSTDTTLSKNRNDIDWNIIKQEIEQLNESWSIIILDLYSLNTTGNTILEFSSKLNKSIIAIKNENKQESLMALADLYSSIPLFLKEIGENTNTQKIRQTQSYIINAYSMGDDITNPEINSNIQKAIDIYSEVMGNIDYTKDKTFKTNKVYVLLNELANCIPQEDPELFYIKYKNFMEAINEI